MNSAHFLWFGEGCKAFSFLPLLLTPRGSHTAQKNSNLQRSQQLGHSAGISQHKLGQKPWKKQGESLQMWFQRSSRAQMPISPKPQSWLAMGTSTQPPKDRHGLGLHLSQERHLWALMSKDGQSRALTGIFKLLQASYCDMSSPLHVLAHSALSCLNVVSTPSPEVQCRP